MPFETNNHTETAGNAALSSPAGQLWLGLLEGRM